MLAALYLVIYPIALQPAWEYLYAAVFILCGMIFYLPFVYYKKKVSLIGKSMSGFVTHKVKVEVRLLNRLNPAQLPCSHPQSQWASNPRFVFLVSSSQSISWCHNHFFKYSMSSNNCCQQWLHSAAMFFGAVLPRCLISDVNVIAFRF